MVAVVLAFLAGSLPVLVWAEEGMWLPTHLPRTQLREVYGFEPTGEWLERVQRSCVRMDASGAFVSSAGLLMTNHHVGIDWIQSASTAHRDLVEDGFYAPTRDAELRCPGLEVQVLVSITDVTDRVRAAVPPDASPASAHALRQGTMNRIEEEAARQSGLDCEIVSLFQGARFHLYCYRRYDDVRLVFAPEEGIANFGGDVDNFEYPRHAFDICFFRVYQDGRPLETRDWLPWSREGAREGDLVFAVGHPYQTGRQFTLEELRFARDEEIPWDLRAAWRRESQLRAFSARCPENARVALDDLLGVENWRKAETGVLAGLLDPQVIELVRRREDGLRAWVAADPARQARWGGAWDQIARAQRDRRASYARERLLRRPQHLFDSELFRIAFTLVQLAAERPRPNEERLREYRESELESVDLALFADRRIDDALEIDGLASGLSLLAEELGADDPLVRDAFGGLAPPERARQLVRGCSLRDPEARRAMAAAGQAGIDGSDDPLLRLAALLAPVSRELQLRAETLVEGPQEEGHALIAEARFARDGEEITPDATGTLRVSYGTVRGAVAADGTAIPPFTTFAGLYQSSEEHRGREPFDLPPRWRERRDRLALDTPLNFVQTLDTVGGSSGSPIINPRGEIVGLLFDGNLRTLIWDYVWVDEDARSIGVDSRGIIEALRSVYGAQTLVEELLP